MWGRRAAWAPLQWCRDDIVYVAIVWPVSAQPESRCRCNQTFYRPTPPRTSPPPIHRVMSCLTWWVRRHYAGCMAALCGLGLVSRSQQQRRGNDVTGKDVIACRSIQKINFIYAKSRYHITTSIGKYRRNINNMTFSTSVVNISDAR